MSALTLDADGVVLALAQAQDKAAEMIRSFLDQLSGSSAEEALLRVFPSLDAAQGLAGLQQLAAGEWPMLRIVSADDLPGGYAAYVADLDLIVVSEQALAAAELEPGFLVGLLLEEVGHFIDDHYGGVDTLGDEGAAFRTLIQSGGKIAPTPVAGAADDVGVVVLDDQIYAAELASIGRSGGYEGSQVVLALEGEGDNVLNYNFEFYGIPDRFIVRYENQTIFDSGFVSNYHSGEIKVERGEADFVEVIVATDNQGTSWNYGITSKEDDDDCPDTSPLVIEPQGGKFEHNDDGSCVYTGTVIIGRKDGLSDMLRVEGTVRIDENALTVSNGTVYATRGTYTEPLFTGSFTIPYASGVASGLNASNVIAIGGMETELQGFVVQRDKVLFDLAFDLPGDLGSQAINGQVIPSDILVLDKDGLNFGGTDKQIRLVDVNYTFFELFETKSTNQTLSYIAASDEVRYQGKLSVEALVKGVDTEVTLDLLDENYAAIRGGEAVFKGKLTLDADVPLGRAAFKSFGLEVDTTGQPTTVKGSTAFAFPMKARTPELEVTLGTTLNPLEINTVGLMADKLNIPVPGVNLLFLNKVGVEVDNLAPSVSDGVSVEATVGFSFGPKIPLPSFWGINATDLALIGAEMTGEIGLDGMGGGIGVSVLNEGVLKLDGQGELNWTDKFVSFTGNGVLFEALGGGIARGQLKGKADASFNLGVSGTAQVRLPDIDALMSLGGVSLGTGNMLLTYTHDGVYSNDFGAAWGTLDLDLPMLPKTSILVGAKVTFDGSITILNQASLPSPGQMVSGAATVAALARTANAADGVMPLANPIEGFEVPAGAPYILMFVEWEDETATAPELVVTQPDGSTIAQGDFAEHGIAVVPELSGPGKLGLVMVALEDAGGGASGGLEGGVWNIAPVDASGLGEVTINATAPVNHDGMAVAILDVQHVNDKVVIDFEVDTTLAEGEVILFYDEDGDGFDGTPIASGLAIDAGSYEWDTLGLPTGEYFVYAAYVPDGGVPIYSEAYSAPIDIAASGADLVVSTTLNGKLVGARDSFFTYNITITNQGSVAAEDVVLTESFNPGMYSTVQIGGISTSVRDASGYSRDLGTLAPGESRTAVVAMRLDGTPPTTADHLIAVTSSTPDLDIFNNAEEARVHFGTTAPQPVVSDLQVTVEQPDQGGAVGESASYVLRITNAGPEDVREVQLEEYLLGYRQPTFTVDGQPKYVFANANLSVIPLGDLKAGQSVLVEVAGIIQTAGQTISTSRVTSQYLTDSDSTNNTLVQYRNGEASAVQATNISLTGTTSSTQPEVGDTITLELVLRNDGPSVATGLQVRLDISEGLEFVSGTGIQGTFDRATGIWTVGNMRDNLDRSFTVKLLVNDATNAFAGAQLIAMSEPDLNSAPDNGYIGEDDEVVFFGTPPSNQPTPTPTPEPEPEPEPTPEPEPQPEPEGVRFVSPADDLDEVIEGSAYNDFLDGRGGNDRFIIFGGNDEVFGGDGLDTVVFDFALQAATISITKAGLLQVDGPRGSALLADVEVLEFNDVSVGYLGHADFASIAALYQAALGRAPDVDGLFYWYGEQQAGSTLEDIANSFSASDEFAELYAQSSPQELVMSLYEQVLQRTYDQEGLDYWTAGLESGALGTVDVLLHFVQSDESQQTFGRFDALELL